MVRTTISLTEAQHEGLQRFARARGEAMTAVLRDLVDAVLAQEGPTRRQRADLLVGAFASGDDVSATHDEYLDEAFAP